RKGGWLVYETGPDGVGRGAGMSADAIADVVTTYARPFGWELAPHDLRRTFAKLARSGQALLEQIQLALGHQNIQTTQRYLGSELDLVDEAHFNRRYKRLFGKPPGRDVQRLRSTACADGRRAWDRVAAESRPESHPVPRQQRRVNKTG